MDVYTIGLDQLPESQPKSLEDLRQTLTRFSLYTSIEDRRTYALVTVREDCGTTMFFANGGKEMAWLKDRAHKIDRKSSASVYHVKYDPGT